MSNRFYIYLAIGLILGALINMVLERQWAGNSAAVIVPDEPERFINQNSEMA